MDATDPLILAMILFTAVSCFHFGYSLALKLSQKGTAVMGQKDRNLARNKAFAHTVAAFRLAYLGEEKKSADAWRQALRHGYVPGPRTEARLRRALEIGLQTKQDLAANAQPDNPPSGNDSPPILRVQRGNQ